MKQRIFIYLFIFSVLIILFQYVTSKRIMESQNQKLQSNEARLVTYKDSITILEDDILSFIEFELSAFKDPKQSTRYISRSFRPFWRRRSLTI